MTDKEFRKNTLKNIKMMMKKSPVTFNEENYFSEKDVKHFISEILKIEDENQVLNSLSLSLRKGGIIIIEEDVSCNNINRPDIKLEDVIRKAIVVFKVYIKQRSKSKLKSVEHIHPEKPCVQFEDNPNSMKEYLKALKFILVNQQILIKDTRVFEGLVEAESKVIDCG